MTVLEKAVLAKAVKATELQMRIDVLKTTKVASEKELFKRIQEIMTLENQFETLKKSED